MGALEVERVGDVATVDAEPHDLARMMVGHDIDLAHREDAAALDLGYSVKWI